MRLPSESFKVGVAACSPFVEAMVDDKPSFKGRMADYIEADARAWDWYLYQASVNPG